MKIPSPQAVLIDLAGVLHVGDSAVPGAVEAMRRLQASGLPLRFLTNTTRSPRSAIVDLLRRLGFATGTQATVVGKPAAPFFLGALEELGVAPEHAVLIGDDLRDDILSA